MAKKVWKFAVTPSKYDSGNIINIGMPDGAQILCAKRQKEDVCIWALVDPTSNVTVRRFRFFLTDEALSTEFVRYIETFMDYGGLFVTHLFELI